MVESRLGFHCHRLDQVEERISGNGLHRGEFYNFPSADIPVLRKELINRNLYRSIHAPLVKPDWYPDPPTWSFLCDVEPESRNRTFKMIDETLSHAEDIGAEYVVVHFPIPSTDGAGESDAKLESIAWKSCDRLAELSQKRGIPIQIEGLGNSPYLNSGFLKDALSDYPLSYCFDVGHMNLASQRQGFDLYEFARGMASLTGSIHLWNNRGFDDYLDYRHIPVHPSQKPEEGWADIELLLGILRPLYPVIFESPRSYPEGLGQHDYQDGVEWVKGILQTLS